MVDRAFCRDLLAYTYTYTYSKPSRRAFTYHLRRILYKDKPISNAAVFLQITTISVSQMFQVSGQVLELTNHSS